MTSIRTTYHSHASIYPVFQKQVDSIKMNYAKIGKGPPLIFIHGWTNNWEGWIPIIRYLETKFTLYLLDLPGFGNSGDLNHYSIQLSADYIAEFIRLLKIRPSVVSVSMGSFVAADLARRYPKLINKAILTGPVINDGRHKRFPKAFDLFLKTVQKSSISESALKRIIETRAAAYLMGKYLNMYKFNKEIIDLYGMIGKKLVRKEAYVDMGVSASSYDLKSTIMNLSRPTLLILGDKDVYTSYIYVENQIIPTNHNLSLKVIPEAGHVTPWEKPKDVSEAIVKFVLK